SNIIDRTYSDKVKFVRNEELILETDCIICAVKPKDVKFICNEINKYRKNDNIPIISVSAIVSLDKLKMWLPQNDEIIRCMPNIFCSFGSGCVPYLSTSDNRELIMKEIFEPNL